MFNDQSRRDVNEMNRSPQYFDSNNANDFGILNNRMSIDTDINYSKPGGINSQLPSVSKDHPIDQSSIDQTQLSLNT